MQAHRFGLTDRALALDAYVDAWARAYANLRYQDGGGLFPDRAWRVELFQGVGSGWELSASHDRLVFGSSDTRIHGAGIGYYWGNFYARAKVTHVPDETGDSTGVRGQLRWYYAGNADDYLQVAGGTGRSVEELAQRGSAARVRSNSGSVAWVRYFGDWGMRLGASYADDEGIGRIEKGATVSVYRRW